MTDIGAHGMFFTEPKRLFDDTLTLLEEARDCLLRYQISSLSTRAAAQFAIEGTRLTARLTEMMAWLMGRRAVASGEISYETGRDRYRLELQSVCGVDQAVALEPELSTLRELLNRSLRLYRRIEALDAGFDQRRPQTRQIQING